MLQHRAQTSGWYSQCSVMATVVSRCSVKPVHRISPSPTGISSMSPSTIKVCGKNPAEGIYPVLSRGSTAKWEGAGDSLGFAVQVNTQPQWIHIKAGDRGSFKGLLWCWIVTWSKLEVDRVGSQLWSSWCVLLGSLISSRLKGIVFPSQHCLHSQTNSPPWNLETLSQQMLILYFF